MSGVLQALKRGLLLTKALWVAMAMYLLFFAVIGALVTLVLPYEVVDGQVRVLEIRSGEDLAGRLMPALFLYGIALAGSVYILGGVLGGLHELVREKPFGWADLVVHANRRFPRLLLWGAAYFALSIGVGIFAAFFLSFVWAALGKPALLKPLIGTGASFAFMLVGLALFYSPIILVERARGVGVSFLESWRFVRTHAQGTLLLVFLVSLIGAIAWLLGFFLLAPVVNGLRTLMGVQPFSPGLPVFFFSLILGIPQAFVLLFLPSSLYAYYHGSQPQPKPA